MRLTSRETYTIYYNSRTYISLFGVQANANSNYFRARNSFFQTQKVTVRLQQHIYTIYSPGQYFAELNPGMSRELTNIRVEQVDKHQR